MRSMWNGTTSFGLVRVPVTMHTATGSGGVSFHQEHRGAGGRIGCQRMGAVRGRATEVALSGADGHDEAVLDLRSALQQSVAAATKRSAARKSPRAG